MATTINEALEYDSETDTYSLNYTDCNEPSVSIAVVRAVAEITDTPPTDLDPLYNAIDPDTLNAMYETSTDSQLQGDGGGVMFVFSGCDVAVYLNGLISISPLDAEAE